jgi:hypothetical protein
MSVQALSAAMPQCPGIVAVEVTAQQLVDCLRQQLFGGEVPQQLRPGIGQPGRRLRQHTKLPIQLPNRQQSGIRNDIAAIKRNGHLAPLDLKQHPLPPIIR